MDEMFKFIDDTYSPEEAAQAKEMLRETLWHYKNGTMSTPKDWINRSIDDINSPCYAHNPYLDEAKEMLLNKGRFGLKWETTPEGMTISHCTEELKAGDFTTTQRIHKTIFLYKA